LGYWRRETAFAADLAGFDDAEPIVSMQDKQIAVDCCFGARIGSDGVVKREIIEPEIIFGGDPPTKLARLGNCE